MPGVRPPKNPAKPVRRQVHWTLPGAVHRRLKIAAAVRGESMESLAVAILSDRLPALPPRKPGVGP